MEKENKATLEEILPGYKPEHETTTENIQLSDILGVSQDDFEFIVDVAEMFFLSEKSLSMCIKKTLAMIQERKNMISHAHALTVLTVCMQVRERYQTFGMASEKGPYAVAAYQSAVIMKSMRLASDLGLEDYFNERLVKRLGKEKRKENKSSVIEEAERAVRDLLRRKEDE